MFRSDTLFSRFMNMLFDILYTGILWILCCIPVITIGASTTAAYYTMSKAVRRKTGYVHKEFFRSFKMNFRQSAVMTVLFLAAYFIIGLDLWYVWENDSKANNALFMVLVLILFCVLSITAYFFPLLSRFDRRNMEMVKMSAIVAFKYLPVTICILLVFAVSCVGIYLMPWAVFVVPGVYLFLLSYPMEYVLKKMMPPVEEGSEEAEKWYYQ